MILKDNLYKILNYNSEESEFTLELLPDSVVYRAHFPEQPITPGVCIIQMASELLSEMLGKTLTLHEVANAKFLTAIEPAVTPVVTVRFAKIETSGLSTKATVTFCHEDKTFSKLSLLFQ